MEPSTIHRRISAKASPFSLPDACKKLWGYRCYTHIYSMERSEWSDLVLASPGLPEDMARGLS